MYAEVRPHRGLPIPKQIVSYTDTRLRHELCPVVRQSGAADRGIRIDHPIGKPVVRRAAVDLVPTAGRFGAEAGAKLEPWRYFPGVFDEARSKKRSPTQLRRRRHNRKGR